MPTAVTRVESSGLLLAAVATASVAMRVAGGARETEDACAFGSGIGAEAGREFDEIEWGKGVVRRESSLPADARGGQRIAILAFGTLLHPALAATAGRITHEDLQAYVARAQSQSTGVAPKNFQIWAMTP